MGKNLLKIETFSKKDKSGPILVSFNVNIGFVCLTDIYIKSKFPCSRNAIAVIKAKVPQKSVSLERQALAKKYLKIGVLGARALAYLDIPYITPVLLFISS